MTENARIVDHLLQVEGWPKYTDLPNDRGGPTRGGITLATLSRWRGRPCDRDDLLALEENETREIYEQEYILAPGFGRIEDEILRLQLVDAGVLHGPRRQRLAFLGELIAANYRARRGGKTRQDQSEFAHGWARRSAAFVKLEAERLLRSPRSNTSCRSASETPCPCD